MAACIELLKKSFPKIEGELQDYVSSKFHRAFCNICCYISAISGILQSGTDEFESSEEIYDAIGGILHEVAADKSEDDIK